MNKALMLLAVVFALRAPLSADNTLYFESVSGTYGGHAYGAESYGGPYYISPYFGHIDGNAAGSEVLFCIDFDHYISVPDQTPVVLRSLPADGTFQDSHYQFAGITAGSGASNFISGALPTTFSGSTPTGISISSLSAYQRYEAAVYLLDRDLTAPGLPVQNSRGRALYQYALWALFLQNGPPDGATVYGNAIKAVQNSQQDVTFGSDVNALIADAYNLVTNAANQAYLASLLPYFTVVDSTNNPSCIGCKYQEFLSPNTIPANLPAVPEPSSLILLGTMITGIGLLRRRRKA